MTAFRDQRLDPNMTATPQQGGLGSRMRGAGARRLANALVAGALGGILGGTALAFAVQTIPTENEQRFWLGLGIFILAIVGALVLGVASLIVALVRRSPLAAGLVVFCITAPVFAQLVSAKLWEQETADVPRAQAATATLDLGPPLSVHATGTAECDQVPGQDPDSVFMYYGGIAISVDLTGGSFLLLSDNVNGHHWEYAARDFAVPQGHDGSISFTATWTNNYDRAGAPDTLAGTFTYDCP